MQVNKGCPGFPQSWNVKVGGMVTGTIYNILDDGFFPVYHGQIYRLPASQRSLS